MWKYFVGWFVVNYAFYAYEKAVFGERFYHIFDVLNILFWGGLYLCELFGVWDA